MDDILSKLCEAQVRHHLERLKTAQLKRTVEDWVNRIMNVLSDVPVQEWITAEQISGYLKRYAVDFPLTGGITEIVGECSRKFLSFGIHRETMLKDIFTRKLWDAIVDIVSEMDYLKKKIVHILLRSRLVKHLVADALYSGIVSYQPPGKTKALNKLAAIVSMLDEEIKSTVSSYLAGEQGREEKIRAFVDANLDRFLDVFEAYLNLFFSGERLQDYGDELWEDIFHTPLTEYFEVIGSEDMEDFIVFGYDFWRHFRTTRFFGEVYQEIVKIIVDKYRLFTVPDMLDDMGFTRDVLIEEIFLFIEPFADKLIASGKLEQLLREEIEAFYQSDWARAAITPG